MPLLGPSGNQSLVACAAAPPVRLSSSGGLLHRLVFTLSRTHPAAQLDCSTPPTPLPPTPISLSATVFLFLLCSVLPSYLPPFLPLSGYTILPPSSLPPPPYPSSPHWGPQDSAGRQRQPTHVVYSTPQQCLLLFFRCSAGEPSMVVQRFLDINEPLGEGMDTLTGDWWGSRGGGEVGRQAGGQVER